MSGYVGANSFSTSVDCVNCGCVKVYQESNIAYLRHRNRSGESICTPFIFCSECDKYNNIDARIPVIVKSRILKKKNSYCKPCKGCKTVNYIDESIPYDRKWYHFCEFRCSKCSNCKNYIYFRVYLIPAVTLDILKYKDDHNIHP